MSIRMTSRETEAETSALLDPTASQSIERLPDEEQEPKYTVYGQRWYILVLFTLFNATGNLLWNTWPPVQETCQLVFGWSKRNVLIIGALQAVGSILSVVPSSWFIDTKGRSSFCYKNRVKVQLISYFDAFNC